MDPFPFLLPRSSGPSIPLASASAAALPLDTRRRRLTHLLVPRRRRIRSRGAQLSVSAVAGETTPRTEDGPSSTRGVDQFIPQAPALGPPVHENSKARVVQNQILWFYPKAGPEHKDVLQRKRPPFIAEVDDPEFVTSYATRDLFYQDYVRPCLQMTHSENSAAVFLLGTL